MATKIENDYGDETVTVQDEGDYDDEELSNICRKIAQLEQISTTLRVDMLRLRARVHAENCALSADGGDFSRRDDECVCCGNRDVLSAVTYDDDDDVDDGGGYDDYDEWSMDTAELEILEAERRRRQSHELSSEYEWMWCACREDGCCLHCNRTRSSGKMTGDHSEEGGSPTSDDDVTAPDGNFPDRNVPDGAETTAPAALSDPSSPPEETNDEPDPWQWCAVRFHGCCLHCPGAPSSRSSSADGREPTSKDGHVPTAECRESATPADAVPTDRRESAFVTIAMDRCAGDGYHG